MMIYHMTVMKILYTGDMLDFPKLKTDKIGLLKDLSLKILVDFLW